MKIYIVRYSSSCDENYNGVLNNVAYDNIEAAKEHAAWCNNHPDMDDVIYGSRYFADSQDIPDQLLSTFTAPSEESYAETKAEIDRWCRGQYEDPDLDYPDDIDFDPYDDPLM